MINLSKTILEWTPRNVVSKADKAKRKILMRSGAILMGSAKRSIRKRKKLSTHSRPGTPPYTHIGRKHAYLLRESIVFAMTPNGNSVLIGPSGRKVDFIGQLHEFGLRRSTRITNPEFLTPLKIGRGGPVSSRKYRGTVISSAKYNDPYDGAPVVWAKLKSQRMLEHSRRLQKRLAKAYGKNKSIDYPKRPYMQPALVKVEPKLPALWRKSISQ